MTATIARTAHGLAALTATPLPGARCADDGNPDDFFPFGSGLQAAAAYDRSRRICAGCPAIARCLDGALRRGERYGMFGGLTPDERRGVAGVQRQRRAALVHGMTELEHLGADVDPLIDVIARHRAREAA